jgi:hypothetical protein
MPIRLHWQGRFRAALGRLLGGDYALGDRAWRRILHGLGAGVLLYYVLPPRFFILLPTVDVLLLALAAVLVLEALRHVAHLELPTIRSYEVGRVSSFAYFASGLVVAVLLFPPAVATVVVLGTAFIDPLVGELRRTPTGVRLYPAVPLLAYVALGTIALVAAFRWAVISAAALSIVGSVIALAVERPKSSWIDDDIAMTLVPGIALALLLYFVPCV